MSGRAVAAARRMAGAYGLDALRRRFPAAHTEGRAKAIAQRFQVGRSTAKRWLSEESAIPAAVMLALVVADIEDGRPPRLS